MPQESNEPDTLIDWAKVAPTGIAIPGVELYPAYERKAFAELFVMAAVLQIAFEGENANIKDRFGGYLRFVESVAGNALAVSASEARKRGPHTWAAFCAALKHQDVLLAALAWSELVPRPSVLEAFLKREGRPMSEDEDDYFHRMISPELPPGMGGMMLFAEEWQKAKEAKRKRARREGKSSNQEAELRATLRIVIARDWLIAALWCRSTKGILDYCLPNPSEGDSEALLNHINDVISELGLAKSRCVKLESSIENAVRLMKVQLRRYLKMSRTNPDT